MAERKTTGSGRKAKSKAAPEETRRHVLMRVRIPANVLADSPVGDLPGLLVHPDGTVEAWVPILDGNPDENGVDHPRVIASTSADKACEIAARDLSGGQDQGPHVGAYKAVAVRAWAGGKGWSRPPEPRLEAFSL